jgi:hypothetical protein
MSLRRCTAHPLGNLLARPVMIVVQVDHQRSDRQIFMAAGGTVPRRVLEKVEEPPDSRMESTHVARQQEDTFVCRPEGIGPAVSSSRAAAAAVI